MVIYTRTGDKGQSSTLSGDRLSKDAGVFEAGGTLDELSANTGLARVALTAAGHKDVAGFLARVQDDFINLGAYISSGDPAWLTKLLLTPECFENVIDQITAVRRISGFVVPGENEIEARLHVCRTVCRRCERRLVAIGSSRPDPKAVVYINRLSDLFFALALWSREPFPLGLVG